MEKIHSKGGPTNGGRSLPSDGIQFEQLVREMLIRSGFEVHWTGVVQMLGVTL